MVNFYECVHELPHDATDKQLTEAESHLSPQQLMGMVLLDARAYTIKYVETRKKNDQAKKLDMQNRLNDAIRLLYLMMDMIKTTQMNCLTTLTP